MRFENVNDVAQIVVHVLQLVESREARAVGRILQDGAYNTLVTFPGRFAAKNRVSVPDELAN